MNRDIGVGGFIVIGILLVLANLALLAAAVFIVKWVLGL